MDNLIQSAAVPKVHILAWFAPVAFKPPVSARESTQNANSTTAPLVLHFAPPVTWNHTEVTANRFSSRGDSALSVRLFVRNWIQTHGSNWKPEKHVRHTDTYCVRGN